MFWRFFLITELLFYSIFAFANTQDTREMVAREMSLPIVRGSLVFKQYCVRCHGERGDGQGKEVKLDVSAKLQITPPSREYMSNIIRNGGDKLNLSNIMPPWRDKLSNDQIDDVIAYIEIVTDPVKRGETVFKTNCILCHGVNADGKGRAAVLYNPPPANLTRSDKNDEYKKMIITLGGAAMGRSPVMPIWGEQLTKQEIDDVVAYLHTIKK